MPATAQQGVRIKKENKMPMVELLIKCAVCGYEKTVDQTQACQPMCEKCYMPMITKEVKIKKE